MSISLANLKLAVYSRLNPEGSTPAYAALDAGNITRWANEKTAAVIWQCLANNDLETIHELIVYDNLINLAGGSGSLPADFIKGLAVKTGKTKLPVLLVDQDAFSKWDYVPYDPKTQTPHDNLMQLTVSEEALTLTAGQVSLPVDFVKLLSVKVGSSKLPCLIVDNDAFSKWDYVPYDPKTQTLHDNLMQLTVAEEALTLTTGQVSLPTDFVKLLSVKVGASKTPCLIVDNDAFSKWDYVPFDPATPTPHDDFLQLTALEESIALTSGVGDLPTDFAKILSVKVGSSKLPCLLVNNDTFSKWDYVPFKSETETVHDNILQLTVREQSITLTSGAGDLPDDFVKLLSAKAGTDKLRCLIYANPEDFDRWNENSNFVYKPTANKPVGLILDDKLYIKPSASFSTAYIDYIQKIAVALITDNKISVKPTTHTTAYIDYAQKMPVALIVDDKLLVKPTSITAAYIDYTQKMPVALIVDDKLLVKPTSITAAYIDYTQKMPVALLIDEKIKVKPTYELAPALVGVSGDTTGWTLSNTTGYTQPFNETIAKTGDGTGTITPTAATNIVVGSVYKVVIVVASISGSTCAYTLGGVSGTILSAATTITDYITAVSTDKIIFTPSATSLRMVISSISITKIENTYAYLDYVQAHPDLSSSDSLFTSVGDNMLIDLVVAEAMKHLQLVD